MLTRIIATFTACLLLTSCFLTPGEFEADLTLNDDGSYRFAYVGQIQLVLPEREFRKPRTRPFDPNSVYCESRVNLETGEEEPISENDRVLEAQTAADAATEAAIAAAEGATVETPTPRYSYKGRECTDAELAEKRAEHDRRNAERLAEHEQRLKVLSSVFGGAVPGNDESMEKLAQKLEAYEGWNSVRYQGDDVFLVDYSVEGQVSSGFLFPQFPDTALNMPFVQIIPVKDGKYEIIAPAFGGSGTVATLSKLDRSYRRGLDEQAMLVPSGTFTIRTNGEVLANNNDQGRVRENGSNVIRWNVTEGLESPRALIGPAQ
ncbi:hypothetical protein [Alterisphingorhabdus coralli]|uniref:Lipoprotein n=1 Tax=Alterisphingorhabdus coralli TaxID=3071408 RepID=A0AA97FAZ7_9SPHN|nr:hypothetical protein [Parasphingorhabdus sp. SCSIO 66989]WOE76302.1 hypothetical protein RB602_06210 [Parasphingorhabdus sp. SCSIO 66989]